MSALGKEPRIVVLGRYCRFLNGSRMYENSAECLNVISLGQ